MDILGRALLDFMYSDVPHKLWVHDKFGPKVEMPVGHYFRTDADMPEIEIMALELCSGSVLDIGAGAGSHALWLQDNGRKVKAIDISPGAVEVMEDRGVLNAACVDVFDCNTERYDTLLLLMNGIGLVQNIEGLERFLNFSKSILQPGGQILFDSSDVAYMYEDTPMPQDGYYGNIHYRYEYRNQKSEWFTWLYIDQKRLQEIAAQHSFRTEILMEDESDQYLARLTLLQ